MNEWFSRFARIASRVTGSAATFALAVIVIVVWAVSGPIFKFSDTWQLVINTGTTIVTFLMVFLIQNAQNRDSVAVQLKLDELIRAQSGARNKMMDLEKLTDAQLQKLQQEFDRICAQEPDELSEVASQASDQIEREERKRAA